MPKIFLSYRRADNQALAGRIADSLRARFGRRAVYLDVDTVPGGSDFRQEISLAVAGCNVLLLLIGENWCAAGAGERSRLLDENDLVRIEIESALDHHVPIIPLLAGNTQFPAESNFPSSLEPLKYKNAVRIDDGVDFHVHVDRLIQQIRSNFRNQESPDDLRPADANAGSSAGAMDALARPTPEETATDANARAGAHDTWKQRRIPISFSQGLALSGFLVALNSLLAILGAMLWGDFYYWPAFMVYALACGYFGYWGMVVAVLSPISLWLLLGGPPLYTTIPADILQAGLVLAAFRLGDIDPGLATNKDRLKYLAFGVVLPSALGGALSLLLQIRAHTAAADTSFLQYTGYWTLENAIPVIFPGIWLHGVVSTLRRPFEWNRESYSTSWVGRSFEYTAPWVVSLFITLSISLYLVAWTKIHNFSSVGLGFSLLVVSGIVSILIAVGFSVRHARQTWHLEGAVRRFMTSRQDADRILAGRSSPHERKLVSIMVLKLGDFEEAFRDTRPAKVIDWLNAWYELVAASADRFGGQVDCYSPERTVVAFDARDQDLHADFSLRCALVCIGGIRELNARFAESGIPSCKLGVGIHTGPAIAAEIGPRDRRRYTIIGEAVDVAERLSREAAASADSGTSGQILLSSLTMRQAGIAAEFSDRAGLADRGSLSLDGFDPVNLYVVESATLLERKLTSK
jgi:class 3 adenylate cyclase